MMPWLLSVLAAAALASPPDLILSGGKIFLGPGRFSSAVAVSGNRISAVGSDAAVLALKGPETTVIALKGRAVTPGFHDAHVHFFKGALSLTQIDLSGAATVPEIQRKLADYAEKNPGSGWAIGRGWDQTALPEGAYPTRLDIDAVISSRPVALTDAEGRALWLNSEALKIAKISSSMTKLVKKGIMVDAKGDPSGILLEEAMGLGQRVIPAVSKPEKLAALRRALALARESGVTTVESMPGPHDLALEEQLELWRELYKGGEVTLRHFLFARLEEPEAVAALRKKIRDIPRVRLDIVGVKGFLDGAMADRTAALLEAYHDEAKSEGSLRHKSLFLNQMVRKAHQLGLQVALHAVGDRAARQGLEACQKSQERAQREGLILPPHACRLEHLELVDREDIPRPAALGAAASVQPSHMLFARESQNFHPNRLGARVRQSFPWKSLQDSGALLSFGTDWPAASLHPRLGLYAAATRRTLDGKPEGGWIPQEKLDLERAVANYTEGPSRAMNREDSLGEIAVGKLADLAVFDRDIFSRPEAELLQAEIDLTIFDGKVVFERKAP